VDPVVALLEDGQVLWCKIVFFCLRDLGGGIFTSLPTYGRIDGMTNKMGESLAGVVNYTDLTLRPMKIVQIRQTRGMQFFLGSDIVLNKQSNSTPKSHRQSLTPSIPF
jgi:hypothetical protein